MKDQHTHTTNLEGLTPDNKRGAVELTHWIQWKGISIRCINGWEGTRAVKGQSHLENVCIYEGFHWRHQEKTTGIHHLGWRIKWRMLRRYGIDVAVWAVTGDSRQLGQQLEKAEISCFMALNTRGSCLPLEWAPLPLPACGPPVSLPNMPSRSTDIEEIHLEGGNQRAPSSNVTFQHIFLRNRGRLELLALGFAVIVSPCKGPGRVLVFLLSCALVSGREKWVMFCEANLTS